MKLEESIKYEFKNKDYLNIILELDNRYITLGNNLLNTYIDYVLLNDLKETSDNYQELKNYLLSNEVIDDIVKKFDYDFDYHDRFSDYFKSILASILLDSNIDKVIEYINNIINIKEYILLHNKEVFSIYDLEKRKYKSKPVLEIDGNEVKLHLTQIDEVFKGTKGTLLLSKIEAFEKAYKYIKDNNLELKLKDIIPYASEDDSVTQLQELFDKGYISEPVYKLALKENNNGVDIWKCRVLVEGYRESFSKEDTSNKKAKRLAS